MSEPESEPVADVETLVAPDDQVIRDHLTAQEGVEPGYVRLDDGRTVPEGGNQDNADPAAPADPADDGGDAE